MKNKKVLTKRGLEKKYDAKIVEVEKKELVLDTDPKTGKYYVKADFRKGKKHEEGGEMYSATSGEAIVPANQADKVMAAIKKGDNKTIDSILATLPKDDPEKDSFALGTNQIMSIAGDAIPAIANLVGAVGSKPTVTQPVRVSAPRLRRTYTPGAQMEAIAQQGSLNRQSILTSGGTGLQQRNAAIVNQLNTQNAIAQLSGQEAQANAELQNQQANLDYDATVRNADAQAKANILNQQANAKKGAAVSQAIEDVGQVLTNVGNQGMKQQNEQELRNAYQSYADYTNPLAPAPTKSGQPLDSLQFSASDPDSSTIDLDVAGTTPNPLGQMQFQPTEPDIVPLSPLDRLKFEATEPDDINSEMLKMRKGRIFRKTFKSK